MLQVTTWTNCETLQSHNLFSGEFPRSYDCQCKSKQVAYSQDQKMCGFIHLSTNKHIFDKIKVKFTDDEQLTLKKTPNEIIQILNYKSD